MKQKTVKQLCVQLLSGVPSARQSRRGVQKVRHLTMAEQNSMDALIAQATAKG